MNVFGAFTLTDTETEADKKWLQELCGGCSYCSLNSVHILSVSVSVSVLVSGSVNEPVG